jgi:tetratricopeptide (TPR) repeat protein
VGIYLETGNLEAALAELKRAIELGEREDSPAIRRAGERGFIYYHAKRKEFAKAEELLEKYREGSEGKSDSANRQYEYLKGWIELEKGNAAQAAKHFEKANEGLGTKSFEFTYSLALAYLQDERLTEAVNEYQKLLRRYSEDRATKPMWAVKAYYYSGLAYEKSGRHQKAIEQYEEFLDIWDDADPGITEVKEARARLVRLRQS